MPEQDLTGALHAHQESLQTLETQITAMLHSDVMRENQSLQTECAALKARCLQAQRRTEELTLENQRLKNTLHDQLFNERTQLVNSAQRRAETYYRATAVGEQNRLRALELQIQRRIEALRAALQAEQAPQQAALIAELYDLEQRAKAQLNASRAAYPPAEGAFTAEESARFSALRQEPITEAQLRETEKKNNLEVFIGQNLVNKAGILLLIIGVIAVSQYTLLRLPDVFKGAAIFLLGALLLVFGELLNRRKPNVFSLGITAGGVAVLYVALSVSYFLLGILGTLPSILVCVLVTAAAFFLARRYSSQTIATFALIGGYLPILAVGGERTLLYGAMAYFVALNLLALLLAFQKRWMICAFTGFSLNLLGTIYLMAQTTSQTLRYISFGWMHIIPLLYILFTFLIYTAVPLIGVYRAQKQFFASDIVLLSLNTIMSALVMYAAFGNLGLNRFMGLLAILFAVCYLFLGRLVEQRFQSRRAAVLFYLTGFAFIVLVVPFQFGVAWLSLGWLAEGVALVVYGILRREEHLMRRVGYVICALCLGAFLLFDLLRFGDTLFEWKYLAITLGSLTIWGALLHAKTPRSAASSAFKVVAAVNLWLYLLYAIFHYIYWSPLAYSGHLLACLSLGITVLLAYALLHVRVLAEPALHVLGLVLYGFACLGILGVNLMISPVSHSVFSAGADFAAGTVALVIANAVAVFAMRELLIRFVLNGNANVQLFPLLLSSFGLLLMTQSLVFSYQLAFSSIFISLLYMAAAIAWVILGFMKRYPYLRRFGLGLSMLSVVKLFIIDLFSLTQGFRIVSYFALGVALIAISFVYTHFSKRFEAREEAPHE